MAHVETYEALCRDCLLPRDSENQLRTKGFVVLPGPTVRGGIARLQAAYDAAVVSADIADKRVFSSTRVTDFVNRSSEFDGIYVYPPLMAACCLVIGRPFKLSNTCARTLEPGAPAQELHVDVKYGADGWPLIGYIWMIDAFDTENGATRFIAGSHHGYNSPTERRGGAEGASVEESLACGPEGSLIVFNASIWHGHAANRSSRRRRSVQGHFVPRDGKSAIDYRPRMRSETLGRIGDLARYLLDLCAAV
jgi:ectoine hydroxylase-related dioxygenase (phytanoyl-CoA dioxygenase family)